VQSRAIFFQGNLPAKHNAKQASSDDYAFTTDRRKKSRNVVIAGIGASRRYSFDN
jgi:hypothetical protein